MNRGFFVSQTKMLTSPLDDAKVQRREADGRTLHYIEGWFAMAEANAIFGYDGWDRQTVTLDRVYEQTRNGVTSCAYTARVRITVRARAQLVVREGTGFAQASSNLATDAHERAMKAAETDATKRALATFGGRFGLLLYDKDSRNSIKRDGIDDAAARIVALRDPKESAGYRDQPSARQSSVGGDQTASGCAAPGDDVMKDGFCLVTAAGEVWPVASPESYCSGLRQFLEGARSLEELHRLRQANLPGLTRLRAVAGLVNTRGEHYADILERLLAKRATEFRLAGPATALCRADDSATAQPATNVADLQAAEAIGGSGDQSRLPSLQADTETNEIDEGQSREGPAIPANARGEIHEVSPAIGVGIATPNNAQEAENLATEATLPDQVGLSVGVGPVVASAALENPGQAALSKPTPDRSDTGTTADAPAPNGQGDTSHPYRPTEAPSTTLGQDLAICAGSVRPYVAVPPYPLRAIKAQVLNARGLGDDQKRVAEKNHSDDEALDAKPPQERHKKELAQREENSAHAVSAAITFAPTRRSQISGGYSIDKSVLAVPSERRLRSKAHRVMVAARPCVVCEEMPCHAHHVTFAQPRGLSLKVSDEFTVPLCVKHHNEVHAKGNEAGWWRGQGIDPLVHAQRLWAITAGLLSDHYEAPNGGALEKARNETAASEEASAMDNGAVLVTGRGAPRDVGPGAHSGSAPNSEMGPGDRLEAG